MPKLSPSFLTEIKIVLEKEENKLREELANFIASENSDIEDSGIQSSEEGESASSAAASSNNRALIEQLERGLKDTERALERFQKGLYGICSYCKQVIDEGRLRARPTSSACISCKKTFTQEL